MDGKRISLGSHLSDTDFARHLLERGDFAGAEPSFRQALSLCEESPDNTTEVRADVLKSLATLSVSTTRKPIEAVRYSDAHFHLRVQLNDQSQSAKDDLAMAHRDLGEVYMLSGQYEKSIEHCKQSQEIDFTQPDIIQGQKSCIPEQRMVNSGHKILHFQR